MLATSQLLKYSDETNKTLIYPLNPTETLKSRPLLTTFYWFILKISVCQV